MTAAVKRVNLTRSAYERLRADVLACRIAPGQRLNIVELAAVLEVSPGAVREALSRLTAEGLAIAEPQRGFQAAPISRADLEDLTAVRIAIERMCLERAVASGGLAWESRLVAAHHALSRTPERDPEDGARLGDAWSRAHREFHEALVAGGDSPTLLELRATLYARSERYRQLSAPLAKRRRAVAEEHKSLLAAALARDARRLVDASAKHIAATTEILIEALFTERSVRAR